MCKKTIANERCLNVPSFFVVFQLGLSLLCTFVCLLRLFWVENVFLTWYESCIQCHQIWRHIAKIPFLCVCSTCDSQDAFLFWMFCHTMSKGDLLLCGHPCYVGWVFFGTWIGCHTYYKSFCAFWFLLFFYPILVSVCPRLAIKLCLETFTFLMTGATHWMAGLFKEISGWVLLFLWMDLGPLRTTLCARSSLWSSGGGRMIAQNMGTKIGLIEHIYFVIFCAGWDVALWCYRWTSWISGWREVQQSSSVH